MFNNGNTSKNVTGASIATDGLSGDKIDGGTISNFASTGIDDNAVATAITLDSSNNTVFTEVPYNQTATATLNSSATLDITPPYGAGVFYIKTFCTTLGYGECWGSGTFGQNAGEDYVTADGLSEFDAGFSHITISANSGNIRLVNNHGSRAHSVTVYYQGKM